MITKQEVLEAQKAWGEAVIEIGTLKSLPDEEIDARAVEILKKLYAFEKGTIMFKPTLAHDHPFRDDLEGALSYFVGHNRHFNEDAGFALTPWTAVRFDNHHIEIENDRALVNGEYYFTDTAGHEKKVEYTFGYVKLPSGEVKIDLHHSSLPYAPSEA